MRAPSLAPGLGPGLRLLGAAMGLSRQVPKALGLLEFGGSYPGAYLLRRGLFLPFELKEVLDGDLVAEGLRRLRPMRRLRACLSPDPRAPVARVCALESSVYLRNQLLRDADWAGMAHSVEIRTPLVDFELLKGLAPVIASMNASAGKLALAAAPSTPLPAALVGRAKTGFSVPIGAWLAKAVDAGPAPATKGLTSRAWSQELMVKHRTAA
jgi:asparagine synthase (glutamine-hydrolysing)